MVGGDAGSHAWLLESDEACACQVEKRVSSSPAWRMVCGTCTFWSWAGHCWACAPANIHALPPSWTCPCQHSCLASPLDPPTQDAVELTPGPSLVKAKLALTPHSLDRLLSYHDDNTKEAAFEVALFAEMFLEMLQVRGVWGGGGARKGCGAGVCEKA